MSRGLVFTVCALFLLILPAQASAADLRFQVTTDLGPASGRLFIVIAPRPRPEPRTLIGEAGASAVPMFARDVSNLVQGAAAVVDNSAAAFPIESLDELRPGNYYVQAMLRTNRDLRVIDAPGNLYSDVERVHLDPRDGATVAIKLVHAIPEEKLPHEDEYVRYVKIQSRLLTAFHHRPIYLRAGIILPKSYNKSAGRQYPLRIHIGGYGSRYTAVAGLMAPGSSFRRNWVS